MTRVTIESIGRRGEGVGTVDGQRIYVPFALPGEDAEIDLAGERGILRELRTTSPDRQPPICPYFAFCGGCQLQHLSPATYAQFKRGLVTEALAFRGIDAPVGELVDARGAGRRRATLHARHGGVGYMIQRSHDLFAIDHCPILVPALQKSPILVRAIWQAMGDCDVGLTASETGLDVDVRLAKSRPSKRLVDAAQGMRRLARLTLNGELLLQNAPPRVMMGGAPVELPIGSFLQATAAAEEALAERVVQALDGCTNVADLFCGVGPFALRLARSARITAIDSDRPAAEALAKGARFTQGLKPIVTAVRDLFREPLAADELKRFDGVVFDPPRAGAEAQAQALAASRIKTVVGVSCDPVTFARDAKILVDGGYRLESVTPVDQFAYSTHVEIVGVFRR